MTINNRAVLLFAFMGLALLMVGILQSWALSLTILNLCLISAIMSLGVNIQWGYAGLFNVAVMGFTALGGLAGVLMSSAPVGEAWAVGGMGLFITLVILVLTVITALLIYRRMPKSRSRTLLMMATIVVGYFAIRYNFAPAVEAIEGVNPAIDGYLGGFGMPIIFSWILGGIFAAAVAWLIGKIALGLRSDYLAIATLGISEIIIAMLKNEDWLTRGVKNVSGLPRPVPFEIDLQQAVWFQELSATLGLSVVDFSSIFVKLCYAGLFLIVLVALFWLSQRALHSPWGRMMRAIRDNELSAAAMGKNIKGRHLQVFVLGSAVIGIAGAMMTTLEGQFTPGSYQPLRFTFLIWIMVIVGGSGNNLGAILGGFLIWFVWVEAEPLGLWLMDIVTSGMAEDSSLRAHLLGSAAHMRLMTMGLILLLVLRFSPRGLLPEK